MLDTELKQVLLSEQLQHHRCVSYVMRHGAATPNIECGLEIVFIIHKMAPVVTYASSTTVEVIFSEFMCFN